MKQSEIDMRLLAVSVFGLLPRHTALPYGAKVRLAVRAYMKQLLGESND